MYKQWALSQKVEHFFPGHERATTYQPGATPWGMVGNGIQVF